MLWAGRQQDGGYVNGVGIMRNYKRRKDGGQDQQDHHHRAHHGQTVGLEPAQEGLE
jgi:hypothetical protein